MSQAVQSPEIPAAALASPRVASLDLLRGVAILGILLMNIQCFSMPERAYVVPREYGDLTGLNFVAWAAVHVFADQKFVTVFSLLFGAGIVLQGERLARRRLPPARIHYRRMFWLLLIGLLHAYLLWYGDILVGYAFCGMLLYPAKRLPPAALVVLGLMLIAVGSLYYLSMGLESSPAPLRALGDFYDGLTGNLTDIVTELNAYRGPWLDQSAHRARLSLGSQSALFLMWTLWRCGGAMLLGMALQKWRFFEGAWGNAAYLAMGAGGIALGWGLTGAGILFNWKYNWGFWPEGVQFNHWGSVFAALGYSALGVWFAQFLLPRSRALAKAAAPLVAVGRTAISNYILQTVICTAIFYGCGLFGRVDRIGQIGIVLLVWAVQLTLSTLWLSKFAQGPLEWLWRRATYGDWITRTPAIPGAT